MRRGSIWTGAVIAALGAMACLPAIAQPPKPASPAVNPQSKLPYDISADQQEVFNAEHRTVYKGNVVVIQGTDRLNTPVLNLFFAQKDPSQVKKPAAASPTATSTFGKLERMEAEGPVYFTTPTQNAKGDHGTYLAADDTITLIGNVVLVQDKNVSTGDKLVINQTNDHATLYSKGGASQRVRGVFYQDDQNGQAGGGAKARPARPAGAGRP